MNEINSNVINHHHHHHHHHHHYNSETNSSLLENSSNNSKKTINNEDEDDYESIIDHACSYKSGLRTNGACSHTSAIMLFLSYGKYLEKLPKPGYRLNSFLVGVKFDNEESDNENENTSPCEASSVQATVTTSKPAAKTIKRIHSIELINELMN